MLLTSLQKVSMVMQQGSAVTDDGFGGRVEEVGRQVMCEDDNILQKERKDGGLIIKIQAFVIFVTFIHLDKLF